MSINELTLLCWRAFYPVLMGAQAYILSLFTVHLDTAVVKSQRMIRSFWQLF
jgi:hypothetical protein